MGGHGRRGTRRVLCALLLGALVGASPAAAANTIDVTNVMVSESEDSATFTLKRNAAALSPSRTVAYQTLDLTATAPADYLALSGSLTFASTLFAETQFQRVTVALRGDALDEANETFRFVVRGGEVGAGDATATIEDDDLAPTLTVADSAPTTEGAAGARASFVVRLSAASGLDVAVAYTTADAGATAGQDYTARADTLVLGAGSRQATLDVGVLDDGADEPAEAFELRLSSPRAATLGDGVGTATIVDDDEPAPPVAADLPPLAAVGGDLAPVVALPPVAPPVTVPTAPTTGSSTAPRSLGVSSPRLRRPSTVLVTVSCPQAAGRCDGRVTIFSIASPRSRITALRAQRRLGRLSFALLGGRSQTLELGLRPADRRLLTRTGRMRVRAYALTRDAAGQTGVRSVNGTLIARTAHSSPSR